MGIDDFPDEVELFVGRQAGFDHFVADNQLESSGLHHLVHGDVGMHGDELHSLLVIGEVEHAQIGNHPPDLVVVPHGGR